MEKLLTYIKNKQGYGIIFLLIASLITSIVFSIELKDITTALTPKAILVAEDFLPITVENKQITSPLGIKKRIDINLNDSEIKKENLILPIIMDTTSDSPILPNEKLALFITKNYFYTISPIEIKKTQYYDGTYDINTFSTLLNKIVNTVSTLYTIAVLITNFISLLAKLGITILFGLLSIKLLKIKNKIQINELSRISSFIISFIALLQLTLDKVLMFEISNLSALLITLLLVFLYLSQLTNDTTEKNLL